MKRCGYVERRIMLQSTQRSACYSQRSEVQTIPKKVYRGRRDCNLQGLNQMQTERAIFSCRLRRLTGAVGNLAES